MITLEGFEGFREIGSGGFSTVYSAHQAALDRDVAVKVLEVRGVDVSRIQREIIALGRLSDIPNVITAYELFSRTGRPALVMALMSTSLGGSYARASNTSSDLVVLMASTGCCCTRRCPSPRCLPSRPEAGQHPDLDRRRRISRGFRDLGCGFPCSEYDDCVLAHAAPCVTRAIRQRGGGSRRG